MTFKKRLTQIEKVSNEIGMERPKCIYLCALTPTDEGTSDPKVAYLLRGRMNEQISRMPDESADDFRSRVDSLLLEENAEPLPAEC